MKIFNTNFINQKGVYMYPPPANKLNMAGKENSLYFITYLCGF